MRDLRRGFLLLGLLTLVAATLAFSTVRSSAAESSRLVTQQALDVELLLSVDPIAIEPGQQAAVTVSLKNLSPAPLAPEVQIFLPPSVSARLQELPSGTIFNAQNGTVSWQPVIAPKNAVAQITLPIVAKVADVRAPEQVVSATVLVGDREVRQDTSIWIGVRPGASIRLNPPQVSVGQPVELVGSVSGPTPDAQIWSLGDGRIVEARDPIVVYPAPGVYEIILQVSGPLGLMTASSQVTVVDQSVARFSVSDNMPAVGNAVAFTNESGGQQPLTFLWDFGDGVTSAEASPSHTYQSPGPYEIHLNVKGPGGQSEAEQNIIVGEAPIADFVINEAVDAGAAFQAQAFTDDTATSVSWDMGDGQTHEGDLIRHVYWSAGDYIVTVSVANDYGETRIQHSVRVNPGPLYLFLPIVHYAPADEFEFASPAELPEPDEPAIQVPAGPAQELSPLEFADEPQPTQQLLAYINEARRINGLPALSQVPELSSAAQLHADDMALNTLTGHTGSDGSPPALRVQLSGYPGGYAGEATAWGMSQAIEPVRYWLASPAHREIILNPAATDVGVGFSENYDSANVWYWTAEFASMNLPVIRVPLPAPEGGPPPDPTIDLLGPPRESAFLISPETDLIFTWSWPIPLLPDERFAVYLNVQGRTTQLGTVALPQSENQYSFKISAADVPVAPGQQHWYIRLENTLDGIMRYESESWPVGFLAEPEEAPG